METFQSVILPILVVALLVSLAAFAIVRSERAKLVEDISILRNMIAVNLGILKSEISLLTPLSLQPDALNASAAVTLLEQSKQAADDITIELAADAAKLIASGTPGALEKLLTRVFGAMNQSSQARHLLGACAPYDGE